MKIIDTNPDTRVIGYTGAPSAAPWALLIEGRAIDLALWDYIGNLRVGTPAHAEHEKKPAVRFPIHVLHGDLMYTSASGRLVLRNDAIVRFIRTFKTKEERQKFIDEINLPEGCKYVLARQLEVGQKVYWTDDDEGRTIKEVKIDIDAPSKRPFVRILFLDDSFLDYMPDQKVIVKKSPATWDVINGKRLTQTQ